MPPRGREWGKLTPTTPPIEHPNLRVFCCMQSISEKVSRYAVALPYAMDGTLTGAMSLYLSTPRADYLKGSLVCANCK